MQSKKTSVAFAAVALGSLALFGFGCNPFQSAKDKMNEEIGEKVAEGVLGKVTGGKVDLENDSGQVTFKDNKTGGTAAFGEDVKLPDDFTKNLPIYPGSKISGVTTNKENGESAWVMMATQDEVKKVAEWYGAQAKSAGWKEESNMTLDKLETRTYSKGNERLSFSANPSDEEKGGTTIIATWTMEDKAADDSSETSTEQE